MDIFIGFFFMYKVESKVKEPWLKGDLVRSAVLAECCFIYHLLCFRKEHRDNAAYTIAGVTPSRAQGLPAH